MVGKLDFEVKVIVEAAQALADRTTPNDELKAMFQIPLLEGARMENALMQFLDREDLALHHAGLFVRIRAFDSEDRLQLTYKKRFDVDGNDFAGALQQANADDFGDDYEAQIEWGLHQKVLTISRKKRGPGLDGSLELPGTKRSRTIAIDELPSKFNDLFPGGVEDVLKESGVYGPVEGVRWTGKLFDDPDVDPDDNKVSVEIWQIKRTPDTPPEPFVEVSIKRKDPDSAQAAQDELLRRIPADWISEKQSNKTPKVMKSHPPMD